MPRRYKSNDVSDFHMNDPRIFKSSSLICEASLDRRFWPEFRPGISTHMRPSIEIIRVRSLSCPSDLGDDSCVRVHGAVLAKLGGRKGWVRISNGSYTIFRAAKGMMGVPGFDRNAMELSYDSQIELGYTPPRPGDWLPAPVLVSKCSPLEVVLAHWNHPDVKYRLPLQLGLLSFAMGLVGLALGVVAIVLGIIPLVHH